MVKCNLSVILAERNIKIIDVVEATGINRNTVSSFVNNKATGIQYETLEKLCQYLNVTPNDLLKVNELDELELIRNQMSNLLLRVEQLELEIRNNKSH